MNNKVSVSKIYTIENQQSYSYKNLLTLPQRKLLQRALELSLQYEDSFTTRKNQLPKKYRKMIQNMKMKNSKQLCTICLCKFVQGQNIKRFPCNHIFHRNCGKNWLKINKKCPNCRVDIEIYFKEKEENQKIEENKKSKQKYKVQ